MRHCLTWSKSWWHAAIRRCSLAWVRAAILGIAAAGTAAPPTEEQFALPNGVRVLIVHVPGATKQSMFSFLPLSLATDPAHCSQWSHLIEHLLIRTTDANGLTFEGGSFNGETAPESLRLETICDAAAWREGVRRHAAWLTARSFTVESLEQEKPVIASEESNTATSGYTHKWAIAAWNQIVRHGLDHAALHGDVAGATAESAAEFADAALPLDASVLIATIGPIDPAEIKQALADSLGRAPPQTPDLSRVLAASAPREGAITGTWDLPTRHVLLWWRLDSGPDHQGAAQILGMNALMRLSSGADGARIKCIVHPLVTTPEGTCFIVNASVPDGEEIEAVKQRLREAIAKAAANPGAAARIGGAISQQLTPPDFDAQRPRLPERLRDLAEAQWLLTTAAMCFNWNAGRNEIVTVLRSLDPAAMEATATTLAGAETGSLVIEPVTGH